MATGHTPRSGTETAIGLVAGEASGDVLAASVLRGLTARLGRIDARGIGGPAMAAQGFQNWWSIDTLSVNGYSEVLKAYPRLLKMRNTLRDRLIEWRPDVFVGVDAPDFNFGLELALRQRGIRVAHFISPSIWAWRGERIDKIRECVDHMLLVFPFEQAIYDKAGIAATYVGHPLADVVAFKPDQALARRQLGLPESARIVALLPGSRQAEVTHLAPVFLETALWLARRRPELHFVLPAANAALYERLRLRLAQMKMPERLALTLVQGRSHEALAACDAVLVASGTATLEAALHKRPMVIAYRMAWLNYRLMRNRGYLPWIGLPNILCNESIVPEFLQDKATPAAMGQALLDQMESPSRVERIVERFSALHLSLRQDCARRAADVLAELATSPRATLTSLAGAGP